MRLFFTEKIFQSIKLLDIYFILTFIKNPFQKTVCHTKKLSVIQKKLNPKVDGYLPIGWLVINTTHLVN